MHMFLPTPSRNVLHTFDRRQERGFSSPVVYESLRRNVMRALNESLADWHAQHPPPEPSLLHHRPRRRLSSDKSEARRAKRRRDRAAAWATLTGGGGGRDEKKESVAAAKSIAAKNDPYLSSALHGSSETRSDLDVSSQSTTSSRSHASSDSASSSDAASTTISATASSSNSGGVRGDVFVYVKVDGTEVTEARRAARRIGAGADRVGIVRKLSTCKGGAQRRLQHLCSAARCDCPWLALLCGTRSCYTKPKAVLSALMGPFLFYFSRDELSACR